MRNLFNDVYPMNHGSFYQQLKGSENGQSRHENQTGNQYLHRHIIYWYTDRLTEYTLLRVVV